MQYPETRRVDQTDDYHGQAIADPYRWLEDADAPSTRAWIGEQNAVTRAWLSDAGQRQPIVERLTALWDHPRSGAPWRRGDRWFGLRNSGLQDQDVLYVADEAAGDGRVLIDPNGFSEDGTVALTGLAVSQDGRLAAYATSSAGSDWLRWRVREVGSGEDLDDEVAWSKFSPAAWTPDGAGFFYGAYEPPEEGREYEEANRNQRLRYHRLGTPQTDDELVYARPDQPEWGFHPHVTADGRWLVVHITHGTDPRNRVYVQRLGEGTFLPLLDDFDARYELIECQGDTFYFVTDADAPRGRIIAVDVDRPRREAWREIVGESEDTLERAQLVGGRLVVVYLQHATSRIRMHTLDGALSGEVVLPGLGAVEELTGRPEDDAFCFTFTSFTQPTSVYRHQLGDNATEELWAPKVDLDAGNLVTEQVFVPSGGVSVPMFLVHRADVTPPAETSACQLGADHPTLLWGYGGFNIPVTPMFKVPWMVWVERGGVLAVPNLRGGGEYGRDWHDAGRLSNKQHVFDDAIACAEWLIDHRWTRPAQLAIKGRSNGGLLAGACVTQRPDLFGAAVVEVGVLDMLRFHRFTIGWAWASDYGTADDAEQFETLLAYSPLHNLREGTRYPAVLITTGDHDDRVVPGHSFKFAAALQRAQSGDAPVLLRVETRGGHGAGKPTSLLVAERADVLAFLTRTLEV